MITVKPTSPRPWPNAWLTFCSAVALAVGGCGGDGGQRDPGPQIEGAAASGLADRSDEVARLLDEGDVCGAAHAADQLRAEAEAEIEDGSVPQALASELVATADELVNGVNCEQPELRAPPPPPSEDDKGKERKKKDEGDG